MSDWTHEGVKDFSLFQCWTHKLPWRLKNEKLNCLDRYNLSKEISNCSYCSVLNNLKCVGIRWTQLMMRGQCPWSTGSSQAQLAPVHPTHTPTPFFLGLHNCEEAWPHPPLGHLNSVPHISPQLVFYRFPAFLLRSWFPNSAFWTFILIGAIHRNSRTDFCLKSPEPDVNGFLTTCIWLELRGGVQGHLTCQSPWQGEWAVCMSTVEGSWTDSGTYQV